MALCTDVSLSQIEIGSDEERADEVACKKAKLELGIDGERSL